MFPLRERPTAEAGWLPVSSSLPGCRSSPGSYMLSTGVRALVCEDRTPRPVLPVAPTVACFKNIHRRIHIPVMRSHHTPGTATPGCSTAAFPPLSHISSTSSRRDTSGRPSPPGSHTTRPCTQASSQTPTSPHPRSIAPDDDWPSSP